MLKNIALSVGIAAAFVYSANACASGEILYLVKWEQSGRPTAEFSLKQSWFPASWDPASLCSGKTQCTYTSLGAFSGSANSITSGVGTAGLDTSTSRSSLAFYMSNTDGFSSSAYNAMSQAAQCAVRSGCNMATYYAVPNLYIYTYDLNAGSSSLNGTTVGSPSDVRDCLFDWAERNYASLLSPAATSQTFSPYYFRYYSATRAYLAVASDAHLYYLSPAGVLLDLGAAATWYATARCQ